MNKKLIAIPILGGIAYLVYRAIKAEAAPAPAPPLPPKPVSPPVPVPSRIPTTADILSATTLNELGSLKALIDAAWINREGTGMTYEEYTELYNSYKSRHTQLTAPTPTPTPAPVPTPSHGFKIVMVGVDELRTRLGESIAFQFMGIRSRDYQDALGLGTTYYRPINISSIQFTWPSEIMSATEGMELIYDVEQVVEGPAGFRMWAGVPPLTSGEIMFLGGYVVHSQGSYILGSLAIDFPMQPKDGDVWEWNIDTGTIRRVN